MRNILQTLYPYHFFQWLLFFYLYSFVGWVIESVIVSVQERKWVNRGFLRSPFLPLYGFGALVILLVSIPVRDNAFLVFVCGMAGTTALEYFTGWLMESLFKMKYWDYSDQKFNIKGRICLTSSLFWGLLSLFLVNVLHKPAEGIVLWLSGSHSIWFALILSGLSLLILSDTIYAVRTALDLGKVLGRLSNIQEQLNLAQEQLLAAAQERQERIAEEASQKAESLRKRIQTLREESEKAKSRMDYFHRQLLEAHPSATSAKFQDALEELRDWLSERRRNRKKEHKS